MGIKTSSASGSPWYLAGFLAVLLVLLTLLVSVLGSGFAVLTASVVGFLLQARAFVSLAVALGANQPHERKMEEALLAIAFLLASVIAVGWAFLIIWALSIFRFVR